MNKSWLIGLLIIGILTASAKYFQLDQSLSLSQEAAIQMGMQIWQNECGRRKEGLTGWNKGEDFASLGIGHFIWYPEGQEGIFKEMFPDLLKFFAQQGIELPDWLAHAKGCPWKTREEFLEAQRTPEMEQLRKLLIDHIDLQVCFMVERLQRALPTMLKYVQSEQKDKITFQFYRLIQTTQGIFVLLDYLNFKGEGLSLHERYQGQGWGLMQVLEQMDGTSPGEKAVEEFILAARAILTKRVQNAPIERGEQRWLKGWMNRVESYRAFSLN